MGTSSRALARVPLSQRLAERAANRLGRDGITRRSLFARTAVVASAVTVAPRRFLLEPNTAYAAITDVCGPHNDCASGYTVFCCTINNGVNACPPGSFAGGWWRADGSSWCCGAPRYYIDCHAQCTRCGCAPGQAFCADSCQNCSGRCNGGPTCDQRRVCMNRFRYGQCNQQIGCSGNITCRTVTCTPPYLIPSLACTSASAQDDATAEHSAPCLQQGSWLTGLTVRNDGAIASSPALAEVRGSNRAATFVRGTDGGVWWTVSDQSGVWGPWLGLGAPPGGFNGAPAASSWGPGRLDLWVRGNDDRLWQRFSDNGGANWSDWILPLPDGVLASEPAVTSWGQFRYDLFVLGTDGQIWQRTYDRGWNPGWLGRGRPSAGITGKPAVSSWGPGRLDVFVRGGDDKLYQTFFDGNWSSWIRPPGTEQGTLASAPATASWGSGNVAVFVRGTDNRLWWTNWFQAYWGNWAPIGAVGNILLPGDEFVGDPTAGSRRCQEFDVIVQRSANGLARQYRYSN